MARSGYSGMNIYLVLVLKYGTDVAPNPETVVWLALSVFCAQPGTVVCSLTPLSFVGAGK